MNRMAAAASVLGIGHAIAHSMKNLISVLRPKRKGCHAAARATEQPQKICIVFKNDVSPRNIKILIKNDSAPGTTPRF